MEAVAIIPYVVFRDPLRGPRDPPPTPSEPCLLLVGTEVSDGREDSRCRWTQEGRVPPVEYWVRAYKPGFDQHDLPHLEGRFLPGRVEVWRPTRTHQEGRPDGARGVRVVVSKDVEFGVQDRIA